MQCITMVFVTTSQTCSVGREVKVVDGSSATADDKRFRRTVQLPVIGWREQTGRTGRTGRLAQFFVMPAIQRQRFWLESETFLGRRLASRRQFFFGLSSLKS